MRTHSNIQRTKDSKITHMACLIAMMAFLIRCEESSGLPEEIEQELEKYGIETSGKATTEEKELPMKFNDPNDSNNAFWSLVLSCCLEGGYDLESRAGEIVLWSLVDTHEECRGMPVTVSIIWKEAENNQVEIICVYTVRDADPGIMPAINEEYCR